MQDIFDLFIKKVQKPPKCAIALLLVVDQNPLLKISHIMVVAHRKMKLKLTWRFPPCLLAFTMLEDAMQPDVE